jgi:predicted nucleic acid-binding protein
MRERGISTLYTRDADFLRFREIQVVDPLANASP